MSQPNRKYKSLEALLSEGKPVSPDVSPKPASGDVETLKARIAALESALKENKVVTQLHDTAEQPVPATAPARFLTYRAASVKMPAHPVPATHSENSQLSDEQRRRNMGLFSVFVGGLAGVATLFYFFLYLQTGVWQILAESGFILAAIMTLVGISYPLVRRNKFQAASTWIMVGLSMAYALPEIVWKNATTNLLVTGMLILFMVGTTFPPQPLAWLIVPSLYIAYMFAANIFEPLPRFDINQSTALRIFIPGVTAVIGIWVLWQLYTIIRRFSREETASAQTRQKPVSGLFWQSPYWRAVARLLIEPDETVLGVESRRQAQLLTTSLAILIPFYIVGQFFRNSGGNEIKILIGASIALVLIAAYGLSRTQRFQTGAFLTVAALTASIYSSFLKDTAQFTSSEVLNIIIWTTLPLVISSIILPARSMVFYLTGNVAAMIALAFMPAIPHSPMIPSIAMVAIASILLYVGRRFREQIEQENQSQLIAVNEELETSERISQSLNQNLVLAAEVSRRLSRVRDLSSMLSEATELIRTNFNLYYVQVYLTNPNQTSLLLQAGTGSAGAELLRRRHRLGLDATSINGRAVIERRAVIVSDTAESTFFRPNPLLPETRSEISVPLMVGGIVVGVLDLQSREPGVLNEDVLPAYEALAGQVAIAIQNSILFKQSEEVRRQVEENVRGTAETGWMDYLNGSDRGEKIGYIFDQAEVKPLERGSQVQSGNSLSTPITVTGATIGLIQVAQDGRQWTSSEAEVIQSTAEQLAQHIENLRLLAQAEKYRQEAEQTARRLTREGWEGYLQTRHALAAGYSFSPNEVKIENEALEIDSPATLSLPITVRDEPIGELMINAEHADPQAMNEIFSAVASQLSSHIETLRLLEETELGRNELKKGEARLRTLIENAPEAIVVVDLTTGLFAEPNENAMKLYGLPYQELIKVGPAQMSPPNQPDGRDSTEKAMEKINEAMQGGAPVFDWTHRNAQGQDIPCEVRLVRMPGEKPQVRASVTDITERKKAQEIIAQRANQLETVATVSSTAATLLDPDKLLQAVVDLTKERFHVYHTHIYLTDDAWSTLLLAAGAGEIGRQMVETGHSIEMDAERSLVARASRERKSIIVNDVRAEAGFLSNPMLPETRSEMAVPMIVGDKVIGVFDVQADTLNHFTDEDANIYTTLASQVAVALQNARLYVEQAAAVTQLRELDRLKSSFLANMSHELRTPLNSILGFADVMLEGLDGPLTDTMSNDLSLIQKNGQHLLHLINDVLDMAKIESGKMNLNVEKFNVHELLTDVISITSSLAKEKSLELVIEPDSDHEIQINADKIRLRQVMINLVNNAMKFTDRGGISIRARRENKNILISVKDTGIGISQDHLETVFQEFTQVDTTTTRKAGGTGLGLPISRRLITMHSGRLWAESSGINGEGSTFHVTLPIEANINENATLTAN
ncbi:MAG: GAF domain-containing protein [Chloroflexi bacterium]|nr:GAF domain-containing protein [Chloroflexota bacterium]